LDAKNCKETCLVNLQVGSANAIKDASASIIILVSAVMATFGITWPDSLGAIIVSVYTYSVAYVAAK
jgi:divalent metal cation (Fe/Co/Zn/Cd) transporter